jgi:hypothetical protein
LFWEKKKKRLSNTHLSQQPSSEINLDSCAAITALDEGSKLIVSIGDLALHFANHAKAATKAARVRGAAAMRQLKIALTTAASKGQPSVELFVQAVASDGVAVHGLMHPALALADRDLLLHHLLHHIHNLDVLLLLLFALANATIHLGQAANVLAHTRRVIVGALAAGRLKTGAARAKTLQIALPTQHTSSTHQRALDGRDFLVGAIHACRALVAALGGAIGPARETAAQTVARRENDSRTRSSFLGEQLSRLAGQAASVLFAPNDAGVDAGVRIVVRGTLQRARLHVRLFQALVLARADSDARNEQNQQHQHSTKTRMRKKKKKKKKKGKSEEKRSKTQR